MNEEIEKALHLFEQAVIRAWSLDTEDSFTDRCRKATKDAHAQVIVRRDELKAAINARPV